MRSLTENGRAFETIVNEILRHQFGFRLESRVDLLVDRRIDFAIDDLEIIGEIKFFSSARAPNGYFERANFHLLNAMRDAEATCGVLITSESTPGNKVKLTEHLSLVKWSIPELLYMCKGNAVLSRMLHDFLRSALPFSEVQPIKPKRPKLGTENTALSTLFDVGSATDQEIFSEDAEGSDFCYELRGLGHEEGAPRRFEVMCSNALRYCLSDHLTKWNDQDRSGSGRSIIDLVARISSEHDFWRSMRSDFGSLYVVFEFKWYERKIGQSQIYTTEKYLYRSALRNVSFLISKHGLDEHGLAAARGALREHGKLIVSLTGEDLCKMVQLKNDGDDPVSVLSDIVDEMLLKLER